MESVGSVCHSPPNATKHILRKAFSGVSIQTQSYWNPVMHKYLLGLTWSLKRQRMPWPDVQSCMLLDTFLVFVFLTDFEVLPQPKRATSLKSVALENKTWEEFPFVCVLLNVMFFFFFHIFKITLCIENGFETSAQGNDMLYWALKFTRLSLIMVNWEQKVICLNSGFFWCELQNTWTIFQPSWMTVKLCVQLGINGFILNSRTSSDLWTTNVDSLKGLNCIKENWSSEWGDEVVSPFPRQGTVKDFRSNIMW